MSTSVDAPAGGEADRKMGGGMLRGLLSGLVSGLLVCGALLLGLAGTMELGWREQAVVGGVMLGAALALDRGFRSPAVTLALVLLSMLATLRYGVWRVTSTVHFFTGRGGRGTWEDGVWMGLLLAAEGYAFLILALGYLQTLWPLRRRPVPLPGDLGAWPDVDVLIPTYNEPLSVVRFTALAAVHLDWPADRLHVFLLDDGGREEFRQFAEEAGIGYIARGNNAHAKAGNLNHALGRVRSPYVAIFDSDHVPTRSFLQVTMGWFLRDESLGMLQTPHHFYSPDPFERNLHQFRAIPNEGELFYGVVQDGNDFWNASFFCGSCAVLRRAALDEVGGMAVETVTEDAHTSLKMQRRGWNTAYLNIPQAAGLATERLSGHIRQRIRWARGMVQILRIDNPLSAQGLSWAQRLCYFNALSHFLYALPRLIFLTSPLVYLVFGRINIVGSWTAILAYAVPHLALASVANSRIQGRHRHSFWNEIYETVLAPYILWPTLKALWRPTSGSFNVTAKGGVVGREYFDARVAQPFLVLLGLDLLGLVLAIPRSFPMEVPWLASLYDGAHRGTVAMNVAWTVFNMILLGVAIAVAWESQQRRESVRVGVTLPMDVILPDGDALHGVTADLSSGGVMIRLEGRPRVSAGAPLQLVFNTLAGPATLPATLAGLDGNSLRAQFSALTLPEQETLTLLLYARADTWIGLGEARRPDRPLRSMAHIARLAAQGIGHSLRATRRLKGEDSAGRTAPVAVNVLLVLLCFGCCALAGQTPGAARESHRDRAAGEGAAPRRLFHQTISLRQFGMAAPAMLRTPWTGSTAHFSVSQTETVETALLTLRYRLAPGVGGAGSGLKVSLNGSLIGVVGRGGSASEESADGPGTERTADDGVRTATLVLPAGLVVQRNALRFELAGAAGSGCAAMAESWAEIDPGSSIELGGALLPLRNDLSLLPLPFYDAAAANPVVISMIFPRPPSWAALQAAAIMASWFGTLADERAVRFAVTVGSIPRGDGVVFAEGADALPAALSPAGIAGPMAALRTNPTDGETKLLVLTGRRGEELVAAAQAVSLENALLHSDTAIFTGFRPPPRRAPDDAPRWLSTERETSLSAIVSAGMLESDGSRPVDLRVRLPPDLMLDPEQSVPFRLDYRYNGVPLGDGSTLQLCLNDRFVSATPMPHVEHASARLQTVVPLPASDIRPFLNGLQARFAFHAGADCGAAKDAMQGAIIGDSAIDLSGIPHWRMLPDLEVFAEAGYPFTRLADLAETTVAMPDRPTAGEIELLLTLMGHFGTQTGYPATRVRITDRRGSQGALPGDLLVLGTVLNQPVPEGLVRKLPVVLQEGAVLVRAPEETPLERLWRRLRGRAEQTTLRIGLGGGLPAAVLEGMEWPGGSSRSAVAVIVRDEAAIPAFLDAFLSGGQAGQIGGSVSVLQGSGFVTHPVLSRRYGVGALPWWSWAQRRLAESPWTLSLGLVALCVALALPLRTRLERRARRRLEGMA